MNEADQVVALQMLQILDKADTRLLEIEVGMAMQPPRTTAEIGRHFQFLNQQKWVMRWPGSPYQSKYEITERGRHALQAYGQ